MFSTLASMNAFLYLLSKSSIMWLTYLHPERSALLHLCLMR
jgi:hypothetical protein